MPFFICYNINLKSSPEGEVVDIYIVKDFNAQKVEELRGELNRDCPEYMGYFPMLVFFADIPQSQRMEQPPIGPFPTKERAEVLINATGRVIDPRKHYYIRHREISREIGVFIVEETNPGRAAIKPLDVNSPDYVGYYTTKNDPGIDAESMSTAFETREEARDSKEAWIEDV